MELTTKDAFRCRVVPFSAGEFTGFFRIMSGKSRRELLAMDFKDDATARDLFAETLCRCLCDKNGSLLFAAVSELDDMDSAIMSAVFEECWKANGMSKEAKSEAKKD